MIETAASRALTAELPGLVALMRPKQWVKNGFALAPLVFAGAFVDVGSVNQASLAVLLFCLGSSAAYIGNDLHDFEENRRHPAKSRTRALAAGSVSVPTALLLPTVLYGILALSWFVVPAVALVITAYLATDVLLADWQLSVTVALWICVWGWTLWRAQG